MCTSIAMKNVDFYFGRNMDIDYDFGQRVVITPRNYVFRFKKAGTLERHFAMVGMAAVADGYPLYAEAANEKGLCMAGLNFPENAYYKKVCENGKANISPFELIPWVLGKCKSIAEAKELLSKTCLVKIAFNEKLPLAPLHWHIADKTGSVVLEATKDGMAVYENTVGVMANNPTFDFHLKNLLHYTNLSNITPDSATETKHPFGMGLGAYGLPGDFSSTSRFAKAAFILRYRSDGGDEKERVAQFFRVLDSVAVPKGCVLTTNGNEHYTTYNCCINADNGVYYYKTCFDFTVKEVRLYEEDLEGKGLTERR